MMLIPEYWSDELKEITRRTARALEHAGWDEEESVGTAVALCKLGRGMPLNDNDKRYLEKGL